ncbi:MAG TPA: hypothetical protein VIL28_03550 [Steroidobacteraceae bacterium]
MVPIEQFAVQVTIARLPVHSRAAAMAPLDAYSTFSNWDRSFEEELS